MQSSADNWHKLLPDFGRKLVIAIATNLMLHYEILFSCVVVLNSFMNLRSTAVLKAYFEI